MRLTFHVERRKNFFFPHKKFNLAFLLVCQKRVELLEYSLFTVNQYKAYNSKKSSDLFDFF
jgi:hypothetical protein